MANVDSFRSQISSVHPMLLGHRRLYLDSSHTPPHTCSRPSMAQTAFGTMKICSRQGKFELMSVYHKELGQEA